MARFTKALNPWGSTLKSGITGSKGTVGKGIRLLDDAPVDTVRSVSGNLGMSRGKTDYGKFTSPGHKKYLSQWGEVPKETPRGVKRVGKDGIDDYDR